MSVFLAVLIHLPCFNALHTLRHQLDCQLHVAHLDHGFREDSAGDAVYVAEQADQLGIPISRDRIDVPQLMRDQKLSAEVAARRARYQFYECVSERMGQRRLRWDITAAIRQKRS